MSGREPDERPVVGVFRSPVFNPSEGFIQAQAASLRRYQPLVIGLEALGHVRPELQDRVVLLSTLGQRARLKVLGAVGPLPRALERARPALIHAHFAPDALLALPIARRLHAPLVTSLRGYDVSIPPGRMLASGRLSWMRYAVLGQRLMRAGALFLPVSDALRARAIARGFPPDRTVTHYDGVSLDQFAPAPEGHASPLVLHVGRLVEKKGTALLLKAFAAARRRSPEAQLVILGSGPLAGPLQRLAAELELGDAVRFLGHQSQADVAAWMRRARVLAVPSVRAADGDAEGLPTVAVEAAASGLPAVGSDHSGIPEAIVDGQTGFVVPEGDVAALAERLGALLGSAELGARMGGRARELAQTKFDAVRQAERLEHHYDQVLASHGGLAVEPGPRARTTGPVQ